MHISFYQYLKIRNIVSDNNNILETTNIKEYVKYYNKLDKNKYQAKLAAYNILEVNKNQFTTTLFTLKA